MKNKAFCHAAVSGLILFLVLDSAVADGRLEINQAAINGDGGFPYSINSPGNYVLTSDLIVPGDTTALNITAVGFVSIDLNGFGIQGSAGSRRRR